MRKETARGLFLHYLKDEIKIDEGIILNDSAENRQLKFIKNKLRIILPHFLLKILIYKYRIIKKIFIINKRDTRKYNRGCGNFNKIFSINFVKYVFANPDKNLNLDIFSSEDKIFIDRFIKNRIKLAFNESVPMGELFNLDEYAKFNNEYEEISLRVKKRGNFFVLKSNNQEYKLPLNHFEMSIFFHNYGLSELPTYILKDISTGYVLDVGAYIGDSALKFLEYNPRKVICLEPEKSNFSLLKKTVEINKIGEKVDILNMGAGDKKEELSIKYLKSASCVSNEYRDNIINLQRIDDIFYDKKISLIKVDVEGFEYEVIKGALEIIKRDKPILIIAVYHRGKDFFEIPSLLRNNLSDYEYRLLDLWRTDPICDKFILAYNSKN